eukprot:gnl/TRDRNA2_/TRDRNA2_182263_c0_seq1.p1 gnl/TRDRNA2_/TRDRNA2_182263_c0~~gnl/TRDRNA2_/TRDRNA2_182263_c0_seq1.p1  ORF type:complete len:764 (+),score=128.08 gnl/TRDRNA2_/TRDRNA2_182263_c0_seq1:320-2293(+)
MALKELSVASANPSIVTARLERSGSDVAGAGALAIGNVMRPLVVDVLFECRQQGAAVLKMTYRFSDTRIAPVDLSFTKDCTARPRHGLSLGTSPDHPSNVVHDGQSRWTTKSAAQRIIPTSKNHVDLYWRLQPSAGSDDTASQLMAPPRIRVTPLAANGVAADGPPQTEVRRWQRRLVAQDKLEESRRQQGSWGLPEDLGSVGGAKSPHGWSDGGILRVQLSGSLPNGGALPVTLGEPAEGAYRPALGIELECLREGAALVEVEIASYPAYQPYRPAVASFVKQCGGTVRRGFDLSTAAFSPGANGQHGNLVHDGVVVQKLPDVSNQDSLAAVYWRSRYAELGAPDASRLKCTGGIASASFAQPTVVAHDGPELTGRQDMRFICHKAGTAHCTATFGWRLYGGPSLHFNKVCGGERSDVDITSDLAAAPLVLLAGKDQQSWSERGPEVVLPPDEDQTTFTVSLDHQLRPGQDVLKVAPPQIRVFRPDIVQANVIGMLAGGGEVDASDGADLDVQMHCLGTGTSRIEVTLPIHQESEFKPLNFAFQKRCVLVSYYQQWWVVTLMSFSVLFLISCTVMLALVIRFQMNFKKQEALQAAQGASAPQKERHGREPRRSHSNRPAAQSSSAELTGFGFMSSSSQRLPPSPPMPELNARLQQP